MIGKFKLPQMVTISECAELSGLAKYAVRRLVFDNKVKYVKLGKKYLINFDSLIEYLNNGEASVEGKEETENTSKIRKVGA